MLGRMIASLEDPTIALGLVSALGQPSLSKRLAAAAQASGRAEGDIVTSAVRGFIETASDDHWVQLMGIMNRAEDPALAAMRAILDKELPGSEGG